MTDGEPVAKTERWGEFSVPLGRALKWQLGPLNLLVERRPWEWRLWARRGSDPLATDEAVEMVPQGEPPPEGAEEQRFAFGETADPLRIQPALADRPVIANPDSPFSVLPGEEALAYVTTPLWCVLSVGRSRMPVAEVPLWRPRDTWFGASTREGELCYAARTRLVLDFERLEYRSVRAVTPVRLVNGGPDVLAVQRLRLPVNQLPLYEDAQGILWTPEVTLRRQEQEQGRYDVAGAPPALAHGARKVAEARQPLSDNRLLHVFNAIARTWMV